MTLILNGTSGITDVNGTAAAPAITGTDTDTGVFFGTNTVSLSTGGTERLQVDSSGNLGLGVTPSTYSTGKVVEVGYAGNAFWGYSANTNLVTQNANLVAGTFKYSSTNPASYYQQSASVHSWGIAASGTAGNAITFTQAMTLDASGNLGVGFTSPATKLHVGGSGNQYVRLETTSGAACDWVTTSSDTYFGPRTNTALAFQTNNTERARIDSSGNLLVGATSVVTSEKLNSTNASGAAFRFNGSTSAGAFLGDDLNHYMTTYNSKAGGAVTHYQIGFYNSSGTNVGSITHNFSNTTYSTSSDYRLKENIAPMTGALSVVQQLKPCTYTWKATGEAGQGFIAHELQVVVPDAVVGEKDGIDAEGNPRYQGIDTSFLVATLTAAIKEQQAIITQLQADVAALKGQA